MNSNNQYPNIKRKKKRLVCIKQNESGATIV